MPDFDLQLSAVVDGVNAHSWGDVSSRLTTLESLLKASGQGIDYFNVADNGLRPGKMRSHTSPLSGRFKVRNETGSGLSLGDLVYISGKYSDGTDTYPTVAKAISAISGSFLPAFGVVESAISNSANGTIALVQELTNVNTGGSSIGAPVYLSTTAGSWTLTRPTGNQLIQIVGYVVEVHASTGRILLSPATSVHRFQGTSFGQGLFLDSLAVRTSTPRSQVHIDAGTQDISAGVVTESNYSVQIEGDATLEVGVLFTGPTANSPTASVSATRGASEGSLFFRASSSYGSNNHKRLEINPRGFFFLYPENIVHGLTSFLATDVYAAIETVAGYGASDGGLLLKGIAESSSALGVKIAARSGQPVTTPTTTADPIALIEAVTHSAGSETNTNANGLVFGVSTRMSGSRRNLFLIDAEGDLHVDGSTALTAFDEHEDWQVARAIRTVLDPTQFPGAQELVARYADLLEEMRIVTLNHDGDRVPYINLKRLGLFCLDGLYQIGQKVHENMEQRLQALERKLLHA